MSIKTKSNERIKKFIPFIFISLIAAFTVSCSSDDDISEGGDDPIVEIETNVPVFSATEVPAGGSIIIENSPESSELTIETDGDFELEIIDGNFYLKSNTMGEAEVTVINNDGESATDFITSWGVSIDESGLDYQNIVYAGDTISDNSSSSSSTVAGSIIIPRYIEQNGLYTDILSVPSYAFFANDSITSLSFAKASALTAIENNAFGTCESLASIDFSNCQNLELIGLSTFEGCESLTSIDLTMLSKLKDIDRWAFAHCENITTVDMSNCSELEEVAANMLYSCTSLTTANLSNCTKIDSIGNYAFNSCESLSTVDLSNCTGLKVIAYEAFQDCESLEILDLTDSPDLESVRVWAFDGCTNFKALVISSENVEFKNRVFEDVEDYSIYGVLGSNTEISADERGYNFTDINSWTNS